MIAHAKSFNQDRPNCHFHLSASDRLEVFEKGSFDFVYSNIALQHIEPKYSKQYVREFFRVLRPGGIAVFQLVSATLFRRLFPRWFVESYRRVHHRGRAFIGMFGIPEREVTRVVGEAGGKVLSVERQLTGWRWVSLRYCVAKSNTCSVG